MSKKQISSDLLLSQLQNSSFFLGSFHTRKYLKNVVYKVLLFTAPLCAFADYPTPNVILNGTYTLDGQGAIIDANHLPSSTGYFLKSGTLNISNATLQNFATLGGTGSGGGAGLGGVIFVNENSTLNLNNVSFFGSSVTGGNGGVGDTGGVLNNIFIPTSSGANGDPGSNAASGSGYTNAGNGAAGGVGLAGGSASAGFGGNGGGGGTGAVGFSTSVDTVIAAANVTYLSALAIAYAVADPLLFGSGATASGGAALSLPYIANPALLGYPAPVGTALVALIAALSTEVAFFTAEAIAAGVLDAVAVGILTSVQVAAYQGNGTSGKGGNGGDGNIGGNGSFGFGGGRGGDGGNGGSAVSSSIALAGLGGDSGDGGKGGFGGGGGRSGISGQSGTPGTLVTSGTTFGISGLGGSGGFGAGNGSSGTVSPNGTGGGAGSGFGGAIFLGQGATLNITGPGIFSGNLALGGSSLNGGSSGEAAGTDIFLTTGCFFTIDPGTGNTVVFNGTIADDSPTSISDSAGAGAGVTINSGLVIFTDQGINTYSGQTLIAGGALQAQDGVGVNFSSNINLAGGIFEGHGSLNRFLGSGSNKLQFTGGGIASGFSAAQDDFTVTLNGGQTLIWSTTPYFLTDGASFLFGSPSAENNVYFTNPINLGGSNQTILATANQSNTNQAILSGALSNGSLTIGDSTHTGQIVLSATNTYLGSTAVNGGSLILQGSLASSIVTINNDATLESVNAGLINTTALTVNGTFTIDANQEIATLAGSGSINLNGGSLMLNSGTFSGAISGTDPNSGIIKITPGTLILSGTNSYLGPTQLEEGTLSLTGILNSQMISISPGAIFNNTSGGISNTATVNNNGTFNFSINQTIGALTGSGIASLQSASLTIGSGNYSGVLSGSNSSFGLIKNTSGTLTLSGSNTYVGSTQVNAGILSLTGTLASPIINIGASGTLQDLNGGLSNEAAVTNNGVLYLASDDTITSLTNSGQVNGSNTLTATTYNLQDGSTINANLGLGTLTTTGTVNLNGSSAATTVNVSLDGTLNLNGAQRLSSAANVNVAGTLNVNGTTQIISTLNGNATGSLVANTLQVNNGGSYSGSINTAHFIAAGGTLTIPNSSKFTYQLLTGNGTINAQGNTFINLATVGGNLTFLGNFTNQGILSPGNSPGLTTITGNYNEAGNLILEIENTTPITGFDQVRVGGIATLQPTSFFDVEMTSSALVQGNSFQVIANSVGGPIPINGSLGGLSLTVDATPANPNAILFNLATGAIIVTGIDPSSNTSFSMLGCTADQNLVAESIFNAAIIPPNQIANTIAGQIASAVLSSNTCNNLSFFIPSFYGAMTDFAFMGERDLVNQVWNRVSTFTNLTKCCCPGFSLFSGYLHSDQRDIHHANLTRQDIYAGFDYATCNEFSIGLAFSDPTGKIHSSQGHGYINGVTGLGYFRVHVSPSFILYGTAAGSYLTDHLSRPTLFGGVKTHAKTFSFTGFLGLEYQGKICDEFMFIPRANLTYSQAHVKSFNEQGEIDALHGNGFNAGLLTGELGLSALYSTCIAKKLFALEALGGLEFPMMSYKDNMKMSVIASPNIAYPLYFSDSTKVRVYGGLNGEYAIFKNTTLNAGYQLSSGGNWDHLFTTGIRICL